MLEDMLHVFRDLHHKSKRCFQSLISGHKKQELLSILPSPKTYFFYHWTKEVKHAVAAEVEHAPALGMLSTKQKLRLHKEKEELIMKHKKVLQERWKYIHFCQTPILHPENYMGGGGWVGTAHRSRTMGSAMSHGKPLVPSLPPWWIC